MSSAATAPDRRTALWDALLDADMNVRYWKSLSKRYSRISTAYRATQAVCSSGTVAAWGIAAIDPHVWKTLSVLAGLVSIVFPIFLPTEKVKKMSSLVGAWQQIETTYALLWTRDSTLSSPGTWDDFAKNQTEENKIDETDLPESKKLLQEAYDQVLKARGLAK